MLERAQRAETPVLRFERPDAWAELADYLQEAEARDWCEAEVLPLLAGIAPEFDTYAGEDFARKGDPDVLVDSPAAAGHGLCLRAGS